MTTGRLQSGVNTLQGFKEDKRNKVTPGEAPLLLVFLLSFLFQGMSEQKHHYHLLSLCSHSWC